jgi:hypothetical protein
MIECSDHLSFCMDSHMAEAENLLFSMPIDLLEWSKMMDKCHVQNRFKRSPGSVHVSGGLRLNLELPYQPP